MLELVHVHQWCICDLFQLRRLVRPSWFKRTLRILRMKLCCVEFGHFRPCPIAWRIKLQRILVKGNTASTQEAAVSTQENIDLMPSSTHPVHLAGYFGVRAAEIASLMSISGRLIYTYERRNGVQARLVNPLRTYLFCKRFPCREIALKLCRL